MGAAGRTGMRSRTRRTGHIHKYKCIRRIAVAVCSVLCIFLRVFNLAFFHNFLFLYHAASAVGTAFFSFLTRGSAVRAVRIVFDHSAGDFFAFPVGSEAGASGEPFDKFYYDNNRNHETSQSDDDGKYGNKYA